MSQRTLYAVFTGINAYPEGALSGCIRDVLSVDLFLREQCAQQPAGSIHYAPVYFLAPDADGLEQIAEYETLTGTKLNYRSPTFANLSGPAFEHYQAAADGDICFFYYSGHGSQADAPEVFRHLKPDNQVETLVCVDSRDPAATGARDLVDKELAYLLWKSFHKKNIHALVVMDCCHSGNNTRSFVNEEEFRLRFQPSARNKVPFEQYVGYDTGFFRISNGEASFDIPRYVHLASCRDDEKARESASGGLFTIKLIEALRSGGSGKSYRDLMQGLSLTVRNRATKQSPVAFAVHDKDLDKRFLSDDLLPFRPSFEVRYNGLEKQWRLQGGKVHGIQPGTLMQVSHGADTREVAVTEVFGMYSILDSDAMNGVDMTSVQYQAVLLKLPDPLMKVGIDQSAQHKLQELQKAYAAKSLRYFSLVTTGAEYFIHWLDSGHYALTHADKTIPLFCREKDAAVFLDHTDKVGNWMAALELKNADPKLTQQDFVFNFEVIEGVDLDQSEDFDKVPGTSIPLLPGKELALSYRNGFYPAFRLNVSIHPDSKLQRCYIKALYLESKYGIETSLIRDDNDQLLQSTRNGIGLTLEDGQGIMKTFGVVLDPKYARYNINEITEFLKIIVSEVPVHLDRYQQGGLRLDDPQDIQEQEEEDEQTRELRRRPGRTMEQPQWSVFTFPVRCIGPKREQKLEPGRPADFAAFTMEVPAGFTANAFALTSDDLPVNSERGIGGPRAVDDLHSAEQIWVDVPAAEMPFNDSLNPATDSSIRAIELFPEQEGAALKLEEGSTIVIRSKKVEAGVRSLDNAGLSSAVMPYGYDPELQLYIPLGYGDDEGNVYIERLPPVTGGKWMKDEENTRSFTGSVKLFFKKFFHRNNTNTLAIWKQDGKGGWVSSGITPKAGSKALLLVHGIIGDTTYMLEVFKTAAKDKADYLLTYDYENLATPVPITAGQLYRSLQQAGFGQPGMPELTIVAHSMGGMVSRWMVEQLGAHAFVKRVILVGSPCGGSEMAKMGVSVFSMLTQALNVPGPIKYTITGLSFLLKKLKLHPGTTLQDLANGSGLVNDLAASPLAPGVEYRLVCGDTSLLDTYDGNDRFLKRITAVAKEKLLYPGLSMGVYSSQKNDIAVTLASMQAKPLEGDAVKWQVVPSNHLAYFQEQPSMEVLMDYISN